MTYIVYIKIILDGFFMLSENLRSKQIKLLLEWSAFRIDTRDSKEI